MILFYYVYCISPNQFLSLIVITIQKVACSPGHLHISDCYHDMTTNINHALCSTHTPTPNSHHMVLLAGSYSLYCTCFINILWRLEWRLVV